MVDLLAYGLSWFPCPTVLQYDLFGVSYPVAAAPPGGPETQHGGHDAGGARPGGEPARGGGRPGHQTHLHHQNQVGGLAAGGPEQVSRAGQIHPDKALSRSVEWPCVHVVNIRGM